MRYTMAQAALVRIVRPAGKTMPPQKPRPNVKGALFLIPTPLPLCQPKDNPYPHTTGPDNENHK